MLLKDELDAQPADVLKAILKHEGLLLSGAKKALLKRLNSHRRQSEESKGGGAV